MSYLLRRSQYSVTAARTVFYRANKGVKPSVGSDEPIGHTNQKFGPDDNRQARFLLKEKQVNPNFAINLVHEVPPIEVNGNHVYCDGGGHPGLGHPKVYINLDKPGYHTCGYCGLRYVMAAQTDHD